MSLNLAIKERALEIGFDLAGIAPLGVWKDLGFSRQWVEKGYGGEMRYLENPKRLDPRRILPSAKSVICVGLVYNTAYPYSTQMDEKEVRSQESEARRRTEPRIANGQRTTDKGQKTEVRSEKAEGRSKKAANAPRAGIVNTQFRVSNFQFPVSTSPRAWISRYAWGHDYHEVMRAKLEQLRAAVEELSPGVETRVFVDTGPVVERAFARFSGIGWMGKNTCLINEQKGSWFFLGVLLTSLDLAPDLPAPDRCGSCMRCLEACPTGALVEPYVMDASRCIAYLTIELKGAVPERFRPQIGANVFGCDICQDVCPWNSKSRSQESEDRSQNEKRPWSVAGGPLAAGEPVPPLAENRGPGVKPAVTSALPEFLPMTVALAASPPADTNSSRPAATDNGLGTTDNEPRTDKPVSSFQFPVSLFHPSLEALAEISEADFRRLFAHSPIKRVKYRGWLRNLCVAMGNSGDRRFVPWLERLAQHDDPIVREHAVWALGRFLR